MTNDQRLAILDRHVRELSEIYDSVQVMGSFVDCNNQTMMHHRGSGNWFARQGMAHTFISESLAEDQAIQIAKKLDPPDPLLSS